MGLWYPSFDAAPRYFIKNVLEFQIIYIKCDMFDHHNVINSFVSGRAVLCLHRELKTPMLVLALADVIALELG